MSCAKIVQIEDNTKQAGLFLLLSAAYLIQRSCKSKTIQNKLPQNYENPAGVFYLFRRSETL